NLYRPLSLPQAITLPENVIAPTKEPMKSSTRLPVGIGAPAATMANAAGSATAAIAMKTAARPIIECMKATISGICVIGTMRASVVPTAPPTTSPSSTQARPAAPVSGWIFNTSATVVATAIAMPTMPNALPVREVDGCDKPFSAWMKHTEAIRYSNTTSSKLRVIVPLPGQRLLLRAVARLGLFFLEHLQHPLGDQEAAEHVDRRQRHGQNAHRASERRFGQRSGQHGADDDDRGDRVGHRHQRCVQRRRNVPYDVIADVDRQHEDDQVINEFHRGLRFLGPVGQGLRTISPAWHIRHAATMSSSRF